MTGILKTLLGHGSHERTSPALPLVPLVSLVCDLVSKPKFELIYASVVVASILESSRKRHSEVSPCQRLPTYHCLLLNWHRLSLQCLLCLLEPNPRSMLRMFIILAKLEEHNTAAFPATLGTPPFKANQRLGDSTSSHSSQRARSDFWELRRLRGWKDTPGVRHHQNRGIVVFG